MQQPTEEQLKIFTDRIESEKRFLVDLGWQPQEAGFLSPEVPPFNWIKPSKLYSWTEALDQAVLAWLYQTGWFPVVVKTSYPKVKLKEEEFCYYSHSNYNRLFLFDDLVECVVHGANFETTFSVIAKPEVTEGIFEPTDESASVASIEADLRARGFVHNMNLPC